MTRCLVGWIPPSLSRELRSQGFCSLVILFYQRLAMTALRQVFPFAYGYSTFLFYARL